MGSGHLLLCQKGIFDWRWLKKSEMNSILQENEKDTYWLVAQGPNIVSFSYYSPPHNLKMEMSLKVMG